MKTFEPIERDLGVVFNTIKPGLIQGVRVTQELYHGPEFWNPQYKILERAFWKMSDKPIALPLVCQNKSRPMMSLLFLIKLNRHFPGRGDELFAKPQISVQLWNCVDFNSTLYLVDKVTRKVQVALAQVGL